MEVISVLNGLGKFIIALNGNASKSQLSAGAAWGVLLGLVPFKQSFRNCIVYFIVFLYP